MSIYTLTLVVLGVELVLALKDARYALPVVLLSMLLIPATIKFNVGVNLNVFNLSVLIFMVFALRKYHKVVTPSIHNACVAYALYVALASFLTFGQTNPFSKYVQAIILFALAFVAMPFTLSYIRLEEKCTNWIDRTSLVCGVIIIMYGIYNYISGSNPYMAYVSLVSDADVDMSNAFQEEDRGFITGRISSTFIHPLQLGQCALLLFAYFFYRMRKNTNKVVFIAFSAGLTLMCVLCGSRSAIFPMVMVLVIYVFYLSKKKQLKYIVSAIMLAVFCYPLLPRQARDTIEGLVFVWDQKAANRANISGSSIDGRTEQLEAAFKIVRDNVLLGKGEGYVANYGFRHPEMLGYESIVLRYIVEGGLLGLLAFLVFYFQSYKVLLSYCRSKEDRARTHSLCMSFFVSILLTGISYSFYTLYMIFYFVLLNEIRNKNALSRGYVIGGQDEHKI